MVSSNANLLGKQFCLKNLSLIFWNLLSVSLPWGTELVTCMFGASNEVSNGLTNSPWSSHISNWESDLKLARPQGVFSECMLIVTAIYSEGPQGLLPTRALKNQAGLSPLGGTEALESSRKPTSVITVNTYAASTNNKVLPRVKRHWDNLCFIREIPMNQWNWVTCQEYNKIGYKYWPLNSKSTTNYCSSESKFSDIPVSAAAAIRKADSHPLLSDASWPIHKTIRSVSEVLFWHYPCPSARLLSTVRLRPLISVRSHCFVFPFPWLTEYLIRLV